MLIAAFISGLAFGVLATWAVMRGGLVHRDRTIMILNENLKIAECLLQRNRDAERIMRFSAKRFVIK